jgi:Tfp pilus assembly protein PilF
MTNKKQSLSTKLLNNLFGSIKKIFNFNEVFISESASNFLFSVKDIKQKSKNLVKSNLELAELHLQNNSFFDAKIRYQIILLIEKNNFDALCGLGFIHARNKKYKKAQFYLQKALKGAKTKEEQEDIKGFLDQCCNTK